MATQESEAARDCGRYHAAANSPVGSRRARAAVSVRNDDAGE